MEIAYPASAVPATPDDVLAVLRDQQRLGTSPCCDTDADETVLNRQTTVADWLGFAELMPVDEIARQLNEDWSTDIPLATWRATVCPMETNTVGGVCDLLARYAEMPRVRPSTVMGPPCHAAGAFLTVRSMLADAGADVSDLRPSTPLADYTRRFTTLFLDGVTRLAPGTLPGVHYHTRFTTLLSAASALAFFGGLCVSPGYAFLFSPVMLVAMRYEDNHRPPVSFGPLRTFRDLAVAMARGPKFPDAPVS